VQPNAFVGKKRKPSEVELAEALGATQPLWEALLADLAAEHGVDVREWKSYSPKAGWSLRLLRKKRTIVWLAPCPGCFRVMFILGDRAVKAAREVKLSRRTLKLLDEAPRYPEGTGVRLLVKGPRDIPDIKRLALVKMAYK
jgi:hypothetical protein